MLGIKDILKNRELTRGKFEDVALTHLHIQDAMDVSDGWERLTNSQKKALTEIAGKISRILNGSPDFKAHWDK